MYDHKTTGRTGWLFEATGWKSTLAAVVALAMMSASAMAQGVYDFNNPGGDLHVAGNWTLVSGTPDADSPPPRNGDIGDIAVAARFNVALYTSPQTPPSALRIKSGGQVNLSQGSNLGNHNFVFDGGGFGKSVATASPWLGGDVFLKENGYFNIGSGGRIELFANIQDHAQGAGTLTITGSTGTIRTRASNSYSGGTILDGGVFLLFVADSLGTGFIRVNANGALDIQHASGIRNTQDMFLFDNGTDFAQVILTQSTTVASLTFNDSIFIDPGTYNASSVQQSINFANYFTSPGAQTITVLGVIPEPASLALVALGGVLILSGRRRAAIARA